MKTRYIIAFSLLPMSAYGQQTDQTTLEKIWRTQEEKAWEQGRNARLAGKENTENLYTSLTTLWYDWDGGWHAANTELFKSLGGKK